MEDEASLEDAGHSICSLDVLGTHLLLHTLLPGFSPSPWPRNNGTGWPGSEGSETVSQDKSFCT